MKGLEEQLPMYEFTDHEKKIIEAIYEAGGKIFRTELRKKISGSNTTFIKKILALKNKGIIVEVKERDSKNGRLKTAYTFTDYAASILKFKEKVDAEGWFIASQKIWLLPELTKISKAIFKDSLMNLKGLDVKDGQMYLEILLASNKKPEVNDHIRETLTSCSAFLQNLLVNKLKYKFTDEVEGYIILRYKFDKETEHQKNLSNHIIKYLEAEDPIQQHRVLSEIVESAIRDSQTIDILALNALIAAYSMGWTKQFKSVIDKYREYTSGREPIQLTRIECIISALNVLKKLFYESQKMTVKPDSISAR